MRIHKGDNIIVISGSERGKKGAVSRVLTKRNAVIVEGGRAVRTARKLVGEKWVRVSRRSGKEI